MVKFRLSLNSPLALRAVKYARSIVPLGKNDEAKRYLASVVQEFPGTAEAAQAQAELAKLILL